MSDNKHPTAVIIGGGLGGLFTGAILAHEGLTVTVLEKNATAGGGLQSFRRFGCSFDTGMHVIGGMQVGGNIRRICRYLGILDKMRLRDVDASCADELFFLEDHHRYRIAQGGEDVESQLGRGVVTIYVILQRLSLHELHDNSQLLVMLVAFEDVRYVAEALAGFPSGVALSILARDPGATGGIKQVLCA